MKKTTFFAFALSSAILSASAVAGITSLTRLAVDMPDDWSVVERDGGTLIVLTPPDRSGEIVATIGGTDERPTGTTLSLRFENRPSEASDLKADSEGQKTGLVFYRFAFECRDSKRGSEALIQGRIGPGSKQEIALSCAGENSLRIRPAVDCE